MNLRDPAALGELLDKQGPPLVLFARQWCEVPEDVVQEAFVQLVRQSRPPDNVLGWLYRVVRNGAISAGRSATRRRRHETRVAESHPLWFEPQREGGLDPEAAAAALSELAVADREVIVAYLWGGLSFAALGELIGVSASTAHRRYEAALAQLRERLGIACPVTNKTETPSPILPGN